MVKLFEYDMAREVVLITGAAGLLGEFHCEALLELGAHIIATDISDEQLLRLKENQTIKSNFNKIQFFPLDITNVDHINQLSNHLTDQGLCPTTLVNNAAINPTVSSAGLTELGTLETFDETSFLTEISVGLTGAINCSRVFGAIMAKRNRGNIVNIASDLSVIAPQQSLYRDRNGNTKLDGKKPVSYSTIKHAVIGLTKYLATYYHENNVRCNALSPGGVKLNQNSEFISELEALIPLGRMADIREYKGAIKFLCSDASKYMNGQNLIIDGGRSVW
jgi:NAD(P)-dependent dehydrogenase (short-subunit alcohol dehydrogenase family)